MTDTSPLLLQKPHLRVNAITILATLNFVLIMCGYQFSASLLALGKLGIPSQMVTAPFRAFSLLTSIFCLFAGFFINTRRDTNIWMYLLALCPILWILRIFVDLNFDCPELMYIDTAKVWGYAIYNPIAILSIYLTYDRIEFDKSLIIIMLCFIYVMSLTPLGLTASEVDLLIDSSGDRVGLGGALFSISYASMGMESVMIAICVIFSMRYSIFWKVVSLLAIVLGFYTIFKSGTRSVFLLMVMGIAFWCITIFRNFFLNFSLIAIFSGLLYLIRVPLVELLAKLAPILATRLQKAIEEGDSSGRLDLYRIGMEKMLGSPLVGHRTIDLSLNMVPGYIGHHSSIIDGFAFFGAIAGTMLVILSIYIIWISSVILRFRRSIYNYWIAALLFPKMLHAILFTGLFFNIASTGSLVIIAMIIMARLQKTDLNRTTLL